MTGRGVWGVYTFPTCFRLKLNVIKQLEIELASDDIEVQLLAITPRRLPLGFPTFCTVVITEQINSIQRLFVTKK